MKGGPRRATFFFDFPRRPAGESACRQSRKITPSINRLNCKPATIANSESCHVARPVTAGRNSACVDLHGSRRSAIDACITAATSAVIAIVSAHRGNMFACCAKSAADNRDPFEPMARLLPRWFHRDPQGRCVEILVQGQNGKGKPEP